MPTPQQTQAVSYAAVILADADVEITADKILKLTETAKVEGIEPIYAQVYAKALSSANKKELLTAFGATGSGAPGAGGSAAAAAAGDDTAPAEEAKKEEEEEESDFDMGSLF